MNKLIRDGKVAVLYSPGYGAGWSTWNQECPELLFDPGIVSLLEEERFDELHTYLAIKYPKLYDGGLEDLTIEWIPQGTLFRINEYDGNETIELKEDQSWLVA
jgi:hypothetical protein